MSEYASLNLLKMSPSNMHLGNQLLSPYGFAEHDHSLTQGNRKFDIRAYVLVTPDTKVYLHREAYARTCSVQYKAQELDNM